VDSEHSGDADLYLLRQELQAQADTLERLASELDETNRGVIALNAELQDRAAELRRANELKDRFVRNVSHEIRTPIGAIQRLAHLLLERVDGPLTEEQEQQVRYVARAADDLSALVRDLLDLAKMEAGQLLVRPAECQISELFAGLRGIFRPLTTDSQVKLVFEDPGPLPPLCTDQMRLSQILRNFVSNALRYTSEGEVRVWVEAEAGGREVRFCVSDTGVGIPPEHLPLLFEEFWQQEDDLARRRRGTGLGLPLARRLAEVLGGRLEVTSVVGKGSTFCAVIPMSPVAGDGGGERGADGPPLAGPSEHTHEGTCRGPV
jgi:signal transduction histidine kinase